MRGRAGFIPRPRNRPDFPPNCISPVSVFRCTEKCSCLPANAMPQERDEGSISLQKRGVCRIWGRVAHTCVICAPIKTRDHNPSRRFIRLLIEQRSIWFCFWPGPHTAPRSAPYVCDRAGYTGKRLFPRAYANPRPPTYMDTMPESRVDVCPFACAAHEYERVNSPRGPRASVLFSGSHCPI